MTEYFSHFDLCVAINSWSAAQAGAFLGASLRGSARRLLEGIKPSTGDGYRELRRRLKTRYDPDNVTEMYKAMLRTVNRKEGQSLESFSEDVVKLVRKSYPSIGANTQDQLARDRFIDALDDQELRDWVFKATPKDLSTAVSVGVEAESYLKRDRGRRPRVRALVPSVSEEVASLSTMLQSLVSRQEEMAKAIKKVAEGGTESAPNSRRRPRAGPGPDRRCHRCQSPNHFVANCPEPAPGAEKKSGAGAATLVEGARNAQEN